MIVADSGSTKTSWLAVEAGNKMVTEGLNPHFVTDDRFLAVCNTVRDQLEAHTYCGPVHFYSAGCGIPVQRQRVAQLLARAFGSDDVHVETDMLGACRAVCGDAEGLVGILGTGSNACFYDGKNIAIQAVSTGYILGDHGSANHVGRRLLQDYLCGVMPDGLTDMFHDAYPELGATWLNAVYHQPNANRFLASLAPFAVQHQDNSYCHDILYNSLREWHFYQLKGLRQRTNCHHLSLVGGFAAKLGNVLAEFAEDNDLQIDAILADPIDGLRQYHIKKF